MGIFRNSVKSSEGRMPAESFRFFSVLTENARDSTMLSERTYAYYHFHVIPAPCRPVLKKTKG